MCIDDFLRSNDFKERSTRMKSKQILMLVVMVTLLMQTIFGSLPAVAENPSNVIYVKADATGSNNGTSWADAYNSLQSALDIVQSGQEIWIAAGTYKPTKRTDPADSRTASFQMKNGVAIYGGFSGTETTLAERDFVTNKTILSGDIGVVGNTSDNSYHVFYHSADLNLNSTAILDGVTITRGNANGTNWTAYYGGGMYNDASSPKLTNVIISQNTASFGGGMYNRNQSSPILLNVKFIGNNGGGSGGGMRNIGGSDPEVTNVLFSGNEATYGGGISNLNSNPKLTNVIFSGNEAKDGGGVFNYASSLSLTNAIFIGNKAQNAGGGVFNSSDSSSSLTLTNVTMSGNESTSAPGTISGGGGIIRNSIVVGNGDEPALVSYSGTVENSLLDVNVDGIMLAKFHTTLTDVEADTYESEDIFMDPSQQDYRLQAKSPAINKGIDSYNTITYDLASNKRIQGSAIDLGAYEFPFYTVSYDGNGATGGVPEDNNWYATGNDVTVADNTGNLVKTNYTFASWNTQADGQGINYAANDMFTMGTANVTLYAKWSPSLYTVSFDSDGTTIDIATVKYNEKVTAPTAPTKVGHAFGGWYKDSTFTTIWDFATDVLTGDTTLYAKWTANPYTVTFYSDGTTVDTTTVNYNEKVTVSERLTKAGHTLAGLYKDEDLTEEWKLDTDVVTTDTILYVKWTKNPTYIVTYNGNGATAGQVPVDSTQYEENESVTVQGNSGNLVKPGYTFIGWNTQADGKGTAYVSNATLRVGQANITLYAQWTVNVSPPSGNTAPPTVKIVLNTNGGTTLVPIEITYNTKLSDLPIPTREGFQFDGWYEDAAYTKKWSADILLRENMALYAKWTAWPKDPNPSPPILKDVEQHWAKDMVAELTARGIIKGYSDGTFRPNEPISRMHVAALLTRAFTIESVREVNKFSDVPSTHPYYDAIMALQQAGIVDGTNGAFQPTEQMTRAQLAKLLVGAMGLTPEGTTSFTDVDSNHWSSGYIAVLEREGIALGNNGRFRPNDSVTRAQVVAFLYRVLQKKEQ